MSENVAREVADPPFFSVQFLISSEENTLRSQHCLQYLCTQSGQFTVLFRDVRPALSGEPDRTGTFGNDVIDHRHFISLTSLNRVSQRYGAPPFGISQPMSVCHRAILDRLEEAENS